MRNLAVGAVLELHAGHVVTGHIVGDGIDGPRTGNGVGILAPDAVNLRDNLTELPLLENPHQIDPPFPHVIDPPEFFFSSTNEMQAVRMKNRNSLHSI